MGLAGAGLVVAALFAYAATVPGSFDDAFIVLVYARHLAESGRFYWNAADGPLDGFTSLLDVLLKAALLRAFPHDPVALAWWSELALLAALPLLGALLLQRLGLGAEPLLLALAALVLATSPSLAYASSFLLGTSLYASLALLSVGACLVGGLERASPRFAWVLAGLLVLTLLARPEGLLLAALVLGIFALRQRALGAPLRAALAPAALFAGLALVYFAWRIHQFGYWAPNTYYAKTSALRWNEIVDGARYVASHARSVEGALVLAALPLLAGLGASASWRTPGARWRCGALAACALGLVAGVLWSGGDSYPAGRFLVVPALLAVLGLALAAAAYHGPLPWLPRALLYALVAGQLYAQVQGATTKLAAIRGDWPLREERFACIREVVRGLEGIAPGLVVAQTDFQVFKYFSDATRVVDLQGLNDRAVAHRRLREPVRFGKFDRREGLARDPHVWLYGYRIGTPGCGPLAGLPLRRILADPALYVPCLGYGAPDDEARAIAARYVPATLERCGLHFNFLLRRGLEPRAVELGIRVGS